jgi:hypothetical protein
MGDPTREVTAGLDVHAAITTPVAAAAPMAAQVIVSAVAAAVVLWLFGPGFQRMFEPRVEQFGRTILIPDFFQEWFSARLWREGRSPYTPLREGTRRYLGVGSDPRSLMLELNAHPPPAILVALPFGGLTFRAAFALWNGLSLLALAASIWLVVRTLHPPVPAWAVLPAAAGLVVSFPFWQQMIHGQLNLVLLLLVTGGWAADRAGRQWLAGALVGAALALKLFPGVLLVYFLAAGRWRVALGGLVAALGLSVLAAVVLGPGVFAAYAVEVLPVTSGFARVWSNLALAGLWHKLFDPDPNWGSWVQVVPIVQSPEAAWALTCLSSLAVAGLVAWSARRARSLRERDWAFAAAVAGMILATPVAWDHYCLLLLLPVVLLASPEAGMGRRFLFWPAVAVLEVSPYKLAPLGLTLCDLRYTAGASFVSPPWASAAVLTLPTWALATLFGLVVIGPGSRKHDRQNHGFLTRKGGLQ